MVQTHVNRRAESVTIDGMAFNVLKWVLPSILGMLSLGVTWLISSTVDLRESVALLAASDIDQSEQIRRHELTFQRLAVLENSMSNIGLDVSEMKAEMLGRTRDRYTAEQAAKDWAMQRREDDRQDREIDAIKGQIRDMQRSGMDRSSPTRGASTAGRNNQ